MKNLPNDIYFEICKFLSLQDFCRLSLCSKSISDIKNDELIWKYFYCKNLIMENKISSRFYKNYRLRLKKTIYNSLKKKYKFSNDDEIEIDMIEKIIIKLSRRLKTLKMKKNRADLIHQIFV